MSQNGFFRCELLIEIWFLNKNWTQKLSFWKIFFLQNMIIRNFFYYKICRNEKFSIQNLTFWKFFISNFHCARKRLLQNLILSGKFHFRLWFLIKKVCYKVMPFRMSTKSEQLVVLRWANRVKTLFLRCDDFIEIWFLNENWIQNLNFRKNSLSTKRLLDKFFRNPPGQKNLDSKTDQFVGKNFTSESDIFFKKFHFKFVIFKGKFYFKVMPFKISTKSENLAFFPGTNWVRTFFFRCEFLIEIWFLNKKWTQKLSFWKIFFLSRIWLFEKFSIIKSAGTKYSQYKTWHFGNFSFQNFIVQENACFRMWFFSENFISNSDFQWKSLLQSHAF